MISDFNNTDLKESNRNGEEYEFEVTAVIPCLNEEETLGICIEKAMSSMKKNNIIGEVVIADNGSTDRSIEIAESLGARVAHEELKGYGNALKRGFKEARGKYIIMGDADDSYDWTEIPRFVEEIRKGNDIVMGTRLKGEIKSKAMPWLHRYFGNPVLSWILRTLFRSPISDAYCGLRIFSKEAIERMELKTGGMELALEIVVKSAMLNLKTAEIPITLHPDGRSHPPHLNTFRDGWRSIRFMLLFSPDYLYLLPGATLLISGMIVMAILIQGPIRIGEVGFDIHSLIFGMLMLILGVQIISVGLFAKLFSYTEKFTVINSGIVNWSRKFRMEHALLIGGIASAAGLIINASVFLEWKEGGFGQLEQIRFAILGSTLMIVGAQIVFSGIFLSMLGVSRDTYIGD